VWGWNGHFTNFCLRNNPGKGWHEEGIISVNIVFIFKREIIPGDNHVNDPTEFASMNGIMRGST